jgi:hypothetical protein
MSKMLVIERCLLCPYRKRDNVVVDGTMDVCRLNGRNLDYRACRLSGEFPKGCPLPDAPKEEK